MNLTELEAPIRIYWDIAPARDALAIDHRRIADEIALNKILSLQITEQAPHLSEAAVSVINALSARPVALSLVSAPSALDASTLEFLKERRVKAAFMQASSTKDLEAVAAIVRAANSRPSIGIAFSVTRDNYNELPGVLSFCIEQRIEHLLLPMQRLMTPGTCFTFSRTERTELTKRLAPIEKPSWLKITIHDPFLWRAFYPNVEFPNGGCQAANTMLYISPEADVYPCPMLPVRLGNLLETSLKDVIRSVGKTSLRKKILSIPSACASCGELGQCKGGCRGRSSVLTSAMTEPDPSCA